MAEDPIVIRGGSISIEFHDTFDPDTSPERKRKFKHREEAEARLNRIVIVRDGGGPHDTISLGYQDRVEIHYDAPEPPV